MNHCYRKANRNFLRVLVAVAVAIGAPATALAEDEEIERVSVAASIEPNELPPGAQVLMKVKLELIPGNHANSNRPADPNLIATRFYPKAPEGVSFGRVAYPKPTQVIEWYSTDPLSVFEDGAVIQVLVSVDEEAKPGPVDIEGTLRVQVCDDEMCYPVERLAVKVPITVID